MQIPSILYGTSNEVRGRMRKVATQIAKGAQLREALKPDEVIDVDEVPDALIWMNDSRRGAVSPLAKDFRLALLMNALLSAMSVRDTRAILDAAAATLTPSAWETLLLHSSSGMWLGPNVTNRHALATLLRGTLQHWGEFVELGPRFYDGGFEVGRAIGEPHVSQILVVLNVLGVPRSSWDSSEANSGGPVTPSRIHVDPRPLIRDNDLIVKVERDDSFWSEILRRQLGVPAVKGNIDEVEAECRAGSWNDDYWNLVREERGGETVERILGELAASGAWQTLLGVFVHGLSDMERASDLFIAHRAEEPDLHWARDRIQEYLERTAPRRAAQLLIEDAADYLEPSKPSAYRGAAKTLGQARDLLVEAGLEPVWDEQLEAFRRRHSQRKGLLPILDAAGLKAPARGHAALNAGSSTPLSAPSNAATPSKRAKSRGKEATRPTRKVQKTGATKVKHTARKRRT